MSHKHLLLTPDQEHQKLFTKTSIISFRRSRSLKDIVVGAKAQPIKKVRVFVSRVKNQDVRFASILLLLIVLS